MTNRITGDERWRRELPELLTRIGTMNPGVAASRQSAAIRGNNSQRRSAETPLRGGGSWKGSQCSALALFLVLLLSGCATSRPGTAGSRQFAFEQDTFAYPNELVWEYHFDERGKWVHKRREPNPDYTHHCFVVARAAKQFFQNARFDPAQPKADTKTYRRLIRKVVSTSPRNELPDAKKVVIPGYANLRELSQAQEKLLKANCGGAWRSYFQRGHWRMIWPFTRHHQQKTAEALAAEIRSNRAPVVHLVRFPSLSINHAVVLFDAAENEKEILFAAYDPNAPGKPATLTYDRSARVFSFPTNFYFPGGR